MSPCFRKFRPYPSWEMLRTLSQVMGQRDASLAWWGPDVGGEDAIGEAERWALAGLGAAPDTLQRVEFPVTGGAGCVPVNTEPLAAPWTRTWGR